MRTTIIFTPPLRRCHAVNTHAPAWKEQFKSLINERRALSFSLGDLEPILQFEEELTQLGYQHQVLDSDVHQQFLIPISAA